MAISGNQFFLKNELSWSFELEFKTLAAVSQKKNEKTHYTRILFFLYKEPNVSLYIKNQYIFSNSSIFENRTILIQFLTHVYRVKNYVGVS